MGYKAISALLSINCQNSISELHPSNVKFYFMRFNLTPTELSAWTLLFIHFFHLPTQQRKKNFVSIDPFGNAYDMPTITVPLDINNIKIALLLSNPLTYRFSHHFHYKQDRV